MRLLVIQGSGRHASLFGFLVTNRAATPDPVAFSLRVYTSIRVGRQGARCLTPWDTTEPALSFVHSAKRCVLREIGGYKWNRSLG